LNPLISQNNKLSFQVVLLYICNFIAPFLEWCARAALIV